MQSPYPSPSLSRSRSPTAPLLSPLLTPDRPIDTSITKHRRRRNGGLKSHHSLLDKVRYVITRIRVPPPHILFPSLGLLAILSVVCIFLITSLTEFSPLRTIGIDTSHSAPHPILDQTRFTLGISSRKPKIKPKPPPPRLQTDTRPRPRPRPKGPPYYGPGLGAGQIVTYLPYTYGWGMLLQTLEGYDRAGWKDIVVIDNSWDHHAYSQLSLLSETYPSLLLAIVPTPVHLRFAQIQGFIDHLALRDSGDDSDAGGVYLWSHTDVLILRNETAPLESGVDGVPPMRLETRTPYERTMACINSEDKPTSPGVLFFAYDWLSAVHTLAAKAAPWDPSMPQYGADCDRYARIRLAGYSTWECAAGMGKIMHLHTVLSREQMSELYDTGMALEEQVTYLDTISSSADQYAWRTSPLTQFDSVTEMDKGAASAEDLGGRKYYVDKWGEPFDCELGGRTPKWDVGEADELLGVQPV